jgi:hypothetical protein
MSNVPAGAKTPQDHKPPAQREADGDETVSVDYAGQSYVMPASLDDADGDVLDAIDDQHISYALRALLGDKQWDRFKANKPKVRDYNGLFESYAKATGLDSAGNSSGS